MSAYQKYKSLRLKLYTRVCIIMTTLYFKLNQIDYHPDFVSIGLPHLEVDELASCVFGEKLIMINNGKFSALGRNNKCKITAGRNAKLIVGKGVGMSNVTIISKESITIGNNILLGGGVTIVDTDFHSLDPAHWHTDQDELHMKTSPVKIGDNVFIGMDSIILKGVTIGNNCIIGAGSVVSKNIPPNEIWAGNPAQFIKARI